MRDRAELLEGTTEGVLVNVKGEVGNEDGLRLGRALVAVLLLALTRSLALGARGGDIDLPGAAIDVAAVHLSNSLLGGLSILELDVAKAVTMLAIDDEI